MKKTEGDVHKQTVSRLRGGRTTKFGKEILQACVLCASLADTHPGAVEPAVAVLPKRARRHLESALPAAQRHLVAYPHAWAELTGIE